MTIKNGDALPDVTILRVGEDGADPVKAADAFKGRKVVLFAVPGAFTPTCSAKHLPGFVEHIEALKAKGVDEVACIAVNDPFVMAAWGKAQNCFGKVVLYADGNGDFAKALGLEMDGTKFGLGMRSQRYAMILNDGKVEKLFVEQPGEFKVSTAEHVLEQL